MRGTLRQRGDRRPDYWELVVDAGRDPVTGKRRRTVRSFNGTKRDATRALNELVADTQRGRGRGTTATVGDLIERWLAQLQGNRSPTTLAEYRRLADKHVIPAVGKIQLRRLEPDHLDDLYAGLIRHGLSARSVEHVHSFIRRALNMAVKWDWLDVNPAARATPPTVAKTQLDPPSAADLIRIIEAAFTPTRRRDGTLGVWLQVAAAVGARRGEVCAIRWRDVDLETGTLLIERAVIKDGTRLVVKDTKTHAARRVALGGGTVAVLKAHRDRMDDRAQAGGVSLRPDSYVFSDELDGSRPWRPNRITLAFGRICGELGIENVRLHDLRHFHATQLLTAGVDVRTVAGRGGWSNPAELLKTYAHFVPQADVVAASIGDGLLVARRAAAPTEAGAAEPGLHQEPEAQAGTSSR